MKLVSIKGQETGGRLINDGKDIVVAIREGGNTAVTIIEATSDVLGDIIEKATPLFNQIIALFDDIFNNLPTFIIKDGVRYRLTLQPAGGKEIDIVLYQGEDDPSQVLFCFKERNMMKAKNAMHEHLEALGYIL